MCANQPGESGEAIARGVVGFCLEDRLALNKVYFSQNWEEKNKNKYSRAWGRGGQNPREPVPVLPRQSSPSRSQWLSRFARLQNYLRSLKPKKPSPCGQHRAGVF